jgi:hypothetical protein
MRKSKEHLLIWMDQSIYEHLKRLSDKMELPIQELVTRFITLGLIEERKGPLYFEEESKKVRVNLYHKNEESAGSNQ